MEYKGVIITKDPMLADILQKSFLGWLVLISNEGYGTVQFYPAKLTPTTNE